MILIVSIKQHNSVQLTPPPLLLIKMCSFLLHVCLEPTLVTLMVAPRTCGLLNAHDRGKDSRREKSAGTQWV